MNTLSPLLFTITQQKTSPLRLFPSGSCANGPSWKQMWNTDKMTKTGSCLPIFGCQDQRVAIQNIGSVETHEGRLLTFPNILHHRVEPFKLSDPTQPGLRKIVALFLVDPNLRITSTAHVPCQQQEWWWEAFITTNSQGSQPTTKTTITSLPLELQDAILEDVDSPFSLKEAKALRLDLMEERKKFTLRLGKAFKAITFSLCEH